MIYYVIVVSWGLGYVPPEHRPWNKETTDGYKRCFFKIIIINNHGWWPPRIMNDNPESWSFNHHFDENTIRSISAVTILRLIKLHLHLILSNSLVPLTIWYVNLKIPSFHSTAIPGTCCSLLIMLLPLLPLTSRSSPMLSTVLPWMVSNAHPDSSKSFANLMVAVTVCLLLAPKSTRKSSHIHLLKLRHKWLHWTNKNKTKDPIEFYSST